MAAGSVILTLTAGSALPCSVAVDQFTLHITHQALANAGPDDIICETQPSYTLNAATAGNYASLLWTSSGTGTFNNSTLLNPVYTPTAADIAAGSVTLTLTAHALVPCADASNSMVLSISRQALVNAGPDDTICETQLSYSIASATASHYTSLNWTTSGDGSFSDPLILNPSYQPGANDLIAGLVTLTLSGTSTSPCVNVVDSFVLNIVRNLLASAGPDDSICMNSPYTLSGASASFTSRLKWSHSGLGTLSNAGIIHPTYTPANGETGSILFTLRAYGNSPCSDSIIDQMTLFIHPLPTAVISGQDVICEGDSTRIKLVLSGTAPWNVVVTNGMSNITINGIAASPYLFYVVPPAGINTYTLVSLTDAYCTATPAGLSGNAVIMVNPAPVVDFAYSGGCANDTTFFTVTGNYTALTSYWNWSFGDGTFWTCNSPACGAATHVYADPGAYTVTLFVKDTTGCSYTVSHQVNVRQHPHAFFSFSAPNCRNTPLYFTDLSSNPPGQGYLQQWEWNFGDGSPLQNFTFPVSANTSHIYASAGVYPVTLKVTNSAGCSDFITFNVTVTELPVADFTFTRNCEESETQFVNTSTQGGSGPVTTSSWNFGDPGSGSNNVSTEKDPKHTYLNPGYYTVILVVTNFNGCSDTTQKQIYISPKPLAAFNSSPGCMNSPTTFWADSTITNVHAIATYAWQFGDGGTGSGRFTQHTYTASGSYIVFLTITDTTGCTGTTFKTVVVTPPPVANFSVNVMNCVGQSVQFNDLSTSASGYNTSWVWNFGDGSVQTVLFPGITNVTHTYAQAGTYLATLTVTNSEGCSSTISKTVIISTGPLSNFMYSGHCQGSPVHFTDLTTGTSTNIVTAWAWNFGDPASGILNSSSLQNPSHVFANSGIYVVQLITTSLSGCTATVTRNIIIKALPPVEFTTQGSCQSTPMLFVPGSIINMNSIATWFWQFGDGSNSTLSSPYHTYSAAGSFTAVLTITDTAGCSNTVSHLINIVPTPVVNFGFTSPGCSQSMVIFNDLTTLSAGYITHWTWNFGDGTSQSFSFPNSGPVTHIYANSGNFNVTLTVKTSDSCSSSVSRLLTVSPKPLAAFSSSGGCQDAAVSFNDLSTIASGSSITERLWNFGDPASGTSNTSTLTNPQHIYALAGTYSVQLIVTTASGCSDTATQTVIITPPPLVNFSSQAGCNADTTQFNSSSFVNMATTASWLWQFGDGLTSTLPDPIHVYAVSGTYTVTLTIVSSNGCPASKSAVVTVTPGPLAAFASSSPDCAGSAVLFTDLSSYNTGTITQWHWIFGDGTETTYTTAVPAVSHVYSQPGNFMVKLTVSSQNGCENTYQQIVTVSARPLAGFTYQNTCEGSSTQFSDQSVATSGISILARMWNFGDPASGINNTSSLLNPQHTFSVSGNYMVTLIVVNGTGCSDTVQKQLIITPKPGVDFYHDTITCLGTPLTFHTDTTATNIATVQSYNWDFGDGTLPGNTQNPVHSYANAGNYTVTLTIVNLNGCINSKTHAVTIGESPVSSFSYANACQEMLTQFTDHSFAPNNGTIVSWYWNFGVNGILSDTSRLQNPSFIYTLSGTYTVSLTTTSASGCTNTKTEPVQIFRTPNAAFKFATSPCSHGLVQFQDSSSSYQSVITSWQWEFEPFQFSTAQNPAYTYYALDSCYNVKLIVHDTHGCVDTTFRQVCVPAPLAITFNYQKECFGTPMQFAPQLLTPASDSLLGFAWNFGDPLSGSANTSLAKKPAHTFTKTGFYTVSLTAKDKYGCSAYSFRTIEVKALPVASFTYVSGQCDSTVAFTGTAVDTSALISSYTWNFGDGTSATLNAPNNTIVHKFPSNGLFTVKLTVNDANGCSGSGIATIEQSPCLLAAFANTTPTGCQNKLVSFTDHSTCNGTITEWRWIWGDATPPTVYNTYSPSVTHFYTVTGVYNVKLKVTTLVNGSPYSDSTSRTITIFASPTADFTSSGSCAGSKASFTNSTNPNGTAIVSYSWNFGDAASGKDTSALRNPSYTYPLAGEYAVQLVVVNNLGCSDTITHQVPMYGSPKADFNFSVACQGHATHFFDQSDPTLAPYTHLGWVVTDGVHTIGQMSGQNAAFTFDSLGIYTVIHSVSDSNRCTDTISYKISVVPSPFSVFNVNANYENVQGKVQLENGSLGASDYYWDLGNGETSYAVSPIVTYNDDGDYLIQLYARNNYGCTDSTAIMYKMLFKGLWVPNALAVGPVTAVKLWKPIGVNLSYYKADVYDRWDNLLWTSDKLTDKGAPAEGWDGTYKEKPCQEGAYVWKITAIFSDGTIWRNEDIGTRDHLSGGITGTITLIR